MNAVRLLAQLRAAGASISSKNGRLVIEVQPGVVTADLRAELVKCKADLLAMLAPAPCQHDEDPMIREVRRGLAGLLAVAYRRYAAIQRVGPDQPNTPAKDALANSSGSSVHGVVP